MEESACRRLPVILARESTVDPLLRALSELCRGIEDRVHREANASESRFECSIDYSQHNIGIVAKLVIVVEAATRVHKL